MRSEYIKRINKVIKRLKKYPKSTLLVSSSTVKNQTMDQNYKFSQNRNFYYLTGSNEDNLYLVINSESDVILLAPKVSEKEKLWEGKNSNFKTLSKKINAKLIIYTDIQKEIDKLLFNKENLFSQFSDNFISSQVTKKYIQLHRDRNYKFPNNFLDSNQIFEKLREIKNKTEVDEIKKSIKVTSFALEKIRQNFPNYNNEKEIEIEIAKTYLNNSSEIAFNTIVATSKNANILHYTKNNSKISKKLPTLIDTGCSTNYYCSDISRVYLPKNIESSSIDLYEITLSAQKEAIKSIKPGVSILKPYQVSLEIIIQGLKDLKLLKGSIDKIIEKKEYLPYFPHSIGHSLGLDVHDLFNFQENDKIKKFKKGNVFTIEPGIYIPNGTKKIKPQGFRIEDNILVTSSGNINLSKNIKKELKDITNE